MFKKLLLSVKSIGHYLADEAISHLLIVTFVVLVPITLFFPQIPSITTMIANQVAAHEHTVLFILFTLITSSIPFAKVVSRFDIHTVLYLLITSIGLLTTNAFTAIILGTVFGTMIYHVRTHVVDTKTRFVDLLKWSMIFFACFYFLPLLSCITSSKLKQYINSIKLNKPSFKVWIKDMIRWNLIVTLHYFRLNFALTAAGLFYFNLSDLPHEKHETKKLLLDHPMIILIFMGIVLVLFGALFYVFYRDNQKEHQIEPT